MFSESELELGGGTSVYGAIVMNGSDVHGGQNIYFDEALSETDFRLDDVQHDARQTYLHVTRTVVAEE